MSTESRRHLTNRRTRFRSSTNSERGTVAEELDVSQYVYPNKAPAEPVIPAAKEGGDEIRPAGCICLAFATLFSGLHHCIWALPSIQPGHQRRWSRVLLLLTTCSGAAQLLTGLRQRRRGPADDCAIESLFHCAYGVFWIATTLLQLWQLRDPAAARLLGASLDEDDGPSSAAGCRAASVAASMLLMAAAFASVGFAMAARARITTALQGPVTILLLGMAMALLCLSRGQFQMLHDAEEAVQMGRYGGVMLIGSSLLAFRIALRALQRKTPSIRPVEGRS